MNVTQAETLLETYINGWKQNKFSLLASVLSNDCCIIESHGSTYRGIVHIQEWFDCWLKANSRVVVWDMRSFYFCEIEETAFSEWIFSCVSNKTQYGLEGISVLKFENDKIKKIHEYRMTKPSHLWVNQSLESD